MYLQFLTRNDFNYFFSGDWDEKVRLKFPYSIQLLIIRITIQKRELFHLSFYIGRKVPFCDFGRLRSLSFL